ncbi:hypothetical protein GCM10011495_35580 [Hymenobacter frigidus]|uniref:DUF2975 domain-containing protein n=1 Tax=Hymenobacter frigidus TaxID=1524095 RepID=A0ABQ2AEG9_9BACT|nr:DUF2975 domain-containing protein [Hymenobacter frigidus]GGH90216.1 hypothetical protein GCM10011495_35580 [Hymenobacter frigidus]
MAIIFLVAGAGLVLTLLGRTADAVAVADQEVRLSLHTNQRAAFSFWYGVQAGWEDGSKPKSHPRTDWDQLPPMHLAPSQQFDLVANPTAPLLRYQEPSAWRRVALLCLGALPGELSLPGLLFWIYGSWLLLRLLQDVTPETPFMQANARRLAQLTFLILGLNLWDYVAQVSVLNLVPAFRAAGVAHALNRYVQLSPEDLIPGLQVGFMLFVIAAVYRRGVELSQEADFVI